MTEKQKEQFNNMLATLRRISKDYQTPEQLQKSHWKQFGLEDYEDCLEMSYENIQNDAAQATKGVRAIK